MRIQLGINTCFAVKRWPLPEDWAPIVRDELGLQLVQHSLLVLVFGWLGDGWKDIGVGDFSPTDSCRQRNRFLPTIKPSDSSQLGLLAL